MSIVLSLIDSNNSQQSAFVADEITRLAMQIDVATHRLLTCIRHFDQSEGWAVQGARSCAHWLAWRIGLDPATAREKVRVARALGQLPAIDGALARAELSYAKIRALTRVATPENEARLLEIARETTGDQLERVCRRFRWARRELEEMATAEDERGVRVQPLGNGLMRLEMTLDADEAAMVLRAIEKTRDQLRVQKASRSIDPSVFAETRSESRDVSAEAPPASHPTAARLPLPSRADAIVNIAERALADAPATQTNRGSDHYQVFVHLDQSVVAPDGSFEAFLDDGTHIAAETFRRIMCDSALVGVTSGTDGGPLNIGRRARVIPPAIRRALWVRDQGCRFPACTNRRFTQGHHIRHWLHGGATSLDNLVTLCTFHHHLLHDGGFRIERDATGDLSFFNRYGTPMPSVASPPAVANGPFDDVDDLDLSVCRWDGEPIDVDAVVDSLIVGE